MDLLTLHNLSYCTEDKLILDKLNFNLQAGEFVTLTGPSGSGKSTLLKVIASLLSATEGDILFKGKKQAEYEITNYRQKVSYCFQQPSLFDQTVFDNLQFPFLIRNVPFSKSQVDNALAAVNLPNRYLDKKITDLSGGEKQRIALLRNTLFLPEILLLDEVTVGLDAYSIDIVHQYINQLWQKNNLTIIQITHNEKEIAHATKIMWLEEGRITDVTTSR